MSDDWPNLGNARQHGMGRTAIVLLGSIFLYIYRARSIYLFRKPLLILLLLHAC